MCLAKIDEGATALPPNPIINEEMARPIPLYKAARNFGMSALNELSPFFYTPNKAHSVRKSNKV